MSKLDVFLRRLRLKTQRWRPEESAYDIGDTRQQPHTVPSNQGKKAVFTLNVTPEDNREISEMTYPLLRHYAKKLGAEFVEIRERKFPEWPASYEKAQIYEIGREMGNDWNIFFDYDALVHPDTPDFTCHIPKDTVAHNGSDMASIRFKYDRFYLRDGRNIGSATWCCMASDWCIELFKPVDDMTPEDVWQHIFPTIAELKAGVEPVRLVEDFIFGRNIAKYGLKFITLKDLAKQLLPGVPQVGWFFHIYATPRAEKVAKMKEVMKMWGLG